MMQQEIVENKEFTKINFIERLLPKGEYEYCHFTQCNFSGVNLGSFSFVGCEFENCDFSLASFQGTIVRDVQFINCKLIGIRFDTCDPFLLSFNFRECILDFSSFYKLKIKGTNFIHCKMREIDLTETNLTNSVFDFCDLSGALFNNTILLKSNLTTAENFSIDPEQNIITGARFSQSNIPGLLSRYKIVIEK